MTIQTINNNNVIVNTIPAIDGTYTRQFFSYDTNVLKIDFENNTLSVLHGFDYSVTTNKHTNTFLKDYCHFDFTVADIKKAINNNSFVIGDFKIIL